MRFDKILYDANNFEESWSPELISKKSFGLCHVFFIKWYDETIQFNYVRIRILFSFKKGYVLLTYSYLHWAHIWAVESIFFMLFIAAVFQRDVFWVSKGLFEMSF